ncbi:sigma-70 family RNA polymerase sigma factor [Streptomyces sp. NPDC093991]|uniref:sigma-70 family RNA polymerase sigma factor n=1 Tax=unclassified Streptomyces TaxID=2593676 RepID=UPI00343613F9
MIDRGDAASGLPDADRAGADDEGDGRSDGRLTAAVRDSGDPAAIEELYRRHFRAVLVYARVCSRDPHTAEDLASEAFTRTVRAVRDGKGPTTAWRPYLLSVVRHTAAAWAEQSRRVDLAPEFGQWLDAEGRGGAGPAGEGRTADGEEQVVRAEEGGLVAAAFRSLPERWRAVLWHHVVEEEPAARVGALLGLTPSGVTSLAARAREGLREAYLAAHARQGAADEECRGCSDRLAAVARASRPPRDRRLERHLERCRRCRRAARELADLNQRLRTVLPAAVLLFGGPAYLEARAAAAAVASGQAGAGAASSHAGAGGAAGAKAAVLAVGAAAVIFGGWALWPGGGEPQDRPGAAGGPPSAARSAVPAPSALSTGTPSPSPSSSPSGSSSPSSPSGPSPSAGSPSPSDAGSRPAAPALGGPSTLRFVSTGACMEIPGGSRAAGVRPVGADCDGGPEERWVLLEPYPGDRARTQVRNEATGLCLARSGGTEDHAPVRQQACDATSGVQLWNLWADGGKGEAALRDAEGTRYLGLVEWARADQGQEHGTATGTTRYYYGSASLRFLFEPGFLGG